MVQLHPWRFDQLDKAKGNGLLSDINWLIVSDDSRPQLDTEEAIKQDQEPQLGDHCQHQVQLSQDALALGQPAARAVAQGRTTFRRLGFMSKYSN